MGRGPSFQDMVENDWSVSLSPPFLRALAFLSVSMAPQRQRSHVRRGGQSTRGCGIEVAKEPWPWSPLENKRFLYEIHGDVEDILFILEHNDMKL